MDTLERIPQLEVVSLFNKRKSRYIAIVLNELEAEKLSDDQYKRIRKIFLDGLNSYTRGLFPIIGITIEGLIE